MEDEKTNTTKPKTLAQKLLELRRSVTYLQKDKKGHNCNYASSTLILSTVRPIMDNLGLLLVPNATLHDITIKPTSKTDTRTGVVTETNEFLTGIDFNFVWINADDMSERLECKFYAQGLDPSDKGPGKAMTYGERYFFLKFLNIPTDIDDPDNHLPAGSDGPPPPPPEETKPEKVTSKQIGALLKSSEVMCNLKRPETLTLCANFIGRALNSFDDLTISEASDIIKNINNNTADIKKIVGILNKRNSS